MQGRMYISETHVCFNANIFGWVTNVSISFNDRFALLVRFVCGANDCKHFWVFNISW